MALARLVVVEGPDLGHEFEIPLRGGGIGRGEDNVVQLSDLAVSRSHCLLDLRDGRLCLVDDGSRNRTLVNGKPVQVHVLQEGDEIALGKSRLAFLPSEGGVAVMRESLPSRVTMEVGSRELLRAATQGIATGDDRARRHLASLAGMADALRDAADRDALGRAVCESARATLAADRAFLLFRDAGGRMSPSSAAVAPGDAEGSQLSLPREVIDKVVSEAKAIALDGGHGGRVALAAPIHGVSGDAPVGLLYADRAAAHAFDQVDLMAVGCLAHMVSAAVVGLEVREALTRENRDLEERFGGGGREFVGGSGPARAVMAFVEKVGPSDASVLLTGESGSGKEMVARAIHRASRRSRGPFIAVNCAAMTETLIESELFGHEKGAFTGATERTQGRFEMADKGTLFLDEVGELPLGCQTKFLRVLEEQVFERVGGTRSIRTDVRVVAATNRDLATMARQGGFREDLYYRLSVIHTVVPPLRERREDIPELAGYFLERLRHQVPRRVTGFAHDAMRALSAHPWPGNVRELKNAVERAIVLGDGALIRVQDLPPGMIGGGVSPTQPFNVSSLREARESPASPTPPAGTPLVGASSATNDDPRPVARSLRDLERDGIIAALEATAGNKAQAAQILEIDRSTLYKKIKDYKIEV
ncbi:MAG TPA: sigma 54-interacting transcriptional regulator [Kofleriaceae bacterium]|nr:sigma 54-interacting transcriptional regulator [Kofleriaceae bacterium]